MTATSKCVRTAGTQATTPIPASANANGGPTTLGRINAAAGQPMCEISVFAGAAAFVSGVGFAGLIQCATLGWLSRKDSDNDE